MRAAWTAIFAMMLYGVENAMVKHYFAKMNPFLSMVIMYIPMLFLSAIVLMAKEWTSEPVPRPTSSEMGWMLLTGLVLFAGNICFFSAYQQGATVATVTTSAMLITVFASLCEVYMKWGQPNRYTFIAWFFGAITLYFAMLSQMESMRTTVA